MEEHVELTEESEHVEDFVVSEHVEKLARAVLSQSMGGACGRVSVRGGIKAC